MGGASSSTVDASDQIEVEVSYLLEKIIHDEQELPPLICRRHDEQPLICRHPFGDNIQLDDDFPQICSIGPIHSGRRPETAKCDADKLHVFYATLSLEDGPQICRKLFRFVLQHKDEAVKYYPKEEVVMDEKKFVIMLVLDAHFILSDVLEIKAKLRTRISSQTGQSIVSLYPPLPSMASSSSSSLAANQHQEEINIAISVDDASDQIEVEVSRLLEKIRHDVEKQPPMCRPDEQPRICRHLFGDNAPVDDFPKICSIGPIHSGRRPKTANCDADKLSLFDATMSLQDGPQICHKLIRFVQQHKDEAAKYYSKEVVKDEEKFVIMLVLDAHFILRLLFEYHHWIRTNDRGTAKTYIDGHLYRRWITPYFSSYYTVFEHDFLLLSNQIPFFILEGCFDLLPPTNKPSKFSTLPELLLSTYFPSEPPSSLRLISQDVKQFDHLLHFYRNGVLIAGKCNPPQRWITSILKHKICNRILRIILYLILFPWFCFLHLYQSFISQKEPTAETAVELQDAGVKFKIHFQGSIMKIWFEGGTLNLPRLNIDDKWYSLMWNLLAFEKIKGKHGLTSHLTLLCDLVRSKDDYRLLAEHGILSCRNGEDFGFQKINQLKLLSTVIDARYYRQLQDENFLYLDSYDITHGHMKRYMKEPQHRWRAKLMKDYFNSPWSIVGWVVGGVLFILTLLQTIYTIKSYFHSPS